MLYTKTSISLITGLVMGGLVGAGVALILAPCSGDETRKLIKTKGLEYKDQAGKSLVEVGHRTQEQAEVWQQKGKERLEQGKHAAVETLSHGKDSLVDALAHGKDNLAQIIQHRQNDVPEPA